MQRHSGKKYTPHWAFEKKRACIEGSNRVVRGGSWNNNPENCRVANRNRNNPDNRNNNIGFRLVFVP